MRTTLTTVGSEVALFLDPAVRDALGLQADETVDVNVQGDSLVVRRAGEGDVDPIADAFQRIVEHPAEMGPGDSHYHSGLHEHVPAEMRGSH